MSVVLTVILSVVFLTSNRCWTTAVQRSPTSVLPCSIAPLTSGLFFTFSEQRVSVRNKANWIRRRRITTLENKYGVLTNYFTKLCVYIRNGNAYFLRGSPAPSLFNNAHPEDPGPGGGGHGQEKGPAAASSSSRQQPAAASLFSERLDLKPSGRAVRLCGVKLYLLLSHS